MMNDQPQQEVEPQPQPQQEPELQPQPQPQMRKKRTATRLVDHKEPQEVDFNNIGQHVGKKQSKFANECGVITRSMISVEYTSWKKVPIAQKDMLWLAIKKRWNIPNDNRKKDVLKTCNSQWRAFKKRLKKKCDNQRDPLETYSYLERSTLQSFRQRISSEEFQEISEKARASSMHNKNPARVGPLGYRGKKAEWEQEMASGQLTPQLYQIKSERSLHYVLGRRSKNELGLNIIPPTIQPIVDKLVDVQTQISEGDLELSPGEDLLTKTTIDLMGSQLAKLQAHFDLQQGSRNHAPDDVSLGVQQNNCGSTPTLDALDAIKMPTPCELVLPYGELDQKCAKGLVFPYGNGLIHTLPLRENHLKVLIDDIDSRYENFPVPVMTKEVANLQGAVGTVIQWPRIAIIPANEQRAKKQIPTTSLVPTISRAGTKKNIPNQTSSKARPIEYLRDCLKTNQVVNIVADSGILEVGTYDFSVTCEEYFRLLRKQTIDASIITAWQFKHWVLLVISFRNRVVYILDSLKDRIEKSADYHYLLKKHVDMAFMRYEKNTSTPIGWIFAECNQQLGGLESGHYVMRWMFDFLTTRQHGFPSKSGSIWDDKSPFEEKMLVATVAIWSREFLNNFMNDVVL
uniref:Ubiquitin-like protease family profile domain-containing protein n=1 Tax=Lactuca sativa TaxID=4236 RepID=A0A9R1UTD6_LACSA|nr:hypothetical protein LSAT_V11C800445420 [Lactuca sativa]